MGRIGILEGLATGILLISPPVMTGIERGNGDLLIFSLLALALARRRSMPVATACVTVAAFLKLYPAVTFLALFRPPWRRSLPWVAGALALFGIDVLTGLGEVSQIRHGILHMQWFSFGTTPILIGLQRTMPGWFDYTRVFLLGSVLYVLVLGFSMLIRPRLVVQRQWERQLFAFRIGAPLFIGTFALGTNYDYRMMMLVFCLPLLFALVRQKSGGSSWAWVALVSIIIYASWYFVFEDTYGMGLQFYVKQLVGWMILASLTAILAGTFQPMMRSRFSR